MNGIHGNRGICPTIQTKGHMVAIGGAIIFTIATAAACCLILSNPAGTSIPRLVGFSLVGALECAAIAAVIIGIYSHNRKQRLMEEEQQQHEAPLRPIAGNRVEVSEVLENLCEDLDPLVEALEDLLKSVLIGYHNAEFTEPNPEDLQTISREVKKFRKHLEAIVHSPEDHILILKTVIGQKEGEPAFLETLSDMIEEVLDGRGDQLFNGKIKIGVGLVSILGDKMATKIAKKAAESTAREALVEKLKQENFVSAPRQAAIVEFVMNIYPVIFPALYHVLYKRHAFRKNIRATFCDKNAPLVLPKVEGSDPKGWIATFSEFFNNISNKLKN